MKIMTIYSRKPIFNRDSDWCAYDDETYDDCGQIGWGRTEAEAIADLEEQLEEACAG